MTICYTLDNYWDNIHKVFLTSNAVPHLIYSAKTHSEVINSCNMQNNLYNVTTENNYQLTNELDDVIDYMITNKDISKSQSTIDNNLLTYLVNKNKTDKLNTILKIYDIDPTGMDALLSIVLDNNNATQVKILMDKNIEHLRAKLQKDIDNCTETNCDLNKSNHILIDENAKLRNDKSELSLRNDLLASHNAKLIFANEQLKFSSKFYIVTTFIGVIFMFFAYIM